MITGTKRRPSAAQPAREEQDSPGPPPGFPTDNNLVPTITFSRRIIIHLTPICKTPASTWRWWSTKVDHPAGTVPLDT